MVEVAVYLFYGKFGLVAQLADQLLTVLEPLLSAAVAVVYFLFGYFLQAVAGEVEACVA
jgi:hypothetical protein